MDALHACGKSRCYTLSYTSFVNEIYSGAHAAGPEGRVRVVTQFRFILQPRGFPSEEMQAIFKPCKITHQRFINLGIEGKHPAISASIIFDDNIRDIVQQNLISLGHCIPKREMAKFMQGSLSLKPNLPNFKGRAGWDSNLTILPNPQATQQSATSVQQLVEQSKPDCDTCYMCKFPELSSCKAFQLVDLDAKRKCGHCKEATKVQDWLCMCNQRWHLCIKHQSYANKATDKNTPLSKASRPGKRAVGPLTLAELQEIDARRMRNRPPRVLPPAPNLLSSNLRDRFAHLFT